jgi:hypothetical protein
MIEIDEHHGYRARITLSKYCALEPILEQIPVRQAREHIVIGLMLELFLIALAFDRILHRSYQQLTVKLAFEEKVLGTCLDRQ